MGRVTGWKPLTYIACAVAVAVAGSAVTAQYPDVPQDVEEEATRRRAAADARSDVAWAKALPIIEAWEAKGKPYLPWAAKPTDLPQASIPAFPGAQGGGMYSFGGRGGKVFVVTSLADSGPGSFREALEAAGPRIVVFNVAGIIELKARIRIRAPYITIAGNTAPGDGVCISGDTVAIETHDVVIRHMRFRRGATWVGDRNDALGGNPVGNIMIDHVSASWGLDENMSMYRHMYTPPEGRGQKLPTVNITIQHSISSEALDTYNHSFGSTIGGYNATFHHNLWASNAGRNPSIGMTHDFTFLNNVLYNWRHRTIDGGDDGSYYTIVNNYLKPGPATPEGDPVSHRLLKPEPGGTPTPTFGKAYVAGNIVEGNKTVTDDNWAGGVQIDDEDGIDVRKALRRLKASEAYSHAYVAVQSAEAAYAHVLANAGATLPRRDAVDERIIDMVRTATVTYEAGRGIITDIRQVGGYPSYRGEPYKDRDKDGMRDDWEEKHGLDPADPSDASGDLNADGYTNIEDFINGLDPTAAKVDWTDPKNHVDPFDTLRTGA